MIEAVVCEPEPSAQHQARPASIQAQEPALSAATAGRWLTAGESSLGCATTTPHELAAGRAAAAYAAQAAQGEPARRAPAPLHVVA